MRESDRFRERNRASDDPSESLRTERRGWVLGGVSTQDRPSCLLQIENYNIVFKPSNGRYESICRLVVSRDHLSHFVFLDGVLLVWLEHVLQVASQNDWKLPASCVRTTTRRVLKISSFSLRGSPVLKISESCGNGKVFFVVIPADPDTTGWLSFLLFTQRWIASLGILPPPPTLSATSRAFTDPHKTFAQVVSGFLPDKGRCSASALGSVPSVTVESEGITERRAFLERCIVFRFLSSDRIDWIAFKQWAHRNWDSQLDAVFHKLDDGLWLLHCGSSAQVDRILSSERWCFDQVVLQIDKWIPEAGRSGVLSNEDVVWVTIRGIPLHLRSQELFRQLGETCGHYLGFESGDTLSSIRIRLRLKGAIPAEIPINHGNLSFPVRVTPDSIPPARCYRLPVVSTSDLRSKNKGVLCFSSPSSSTLRSSSTDPSNIASSSCSAEPADWPSSQLFSQTPESVSLVASSVVSSPPAESLSKALERSSPGLFSELK
ncbi:hypothetical protein LINPERHAP2_LOCUS18844 [Linum perenne]